MRACPTSHGLLVAGVLVAGCAEWPRWSHLPDESDAIEAPDDPRALVEREWDEVVEGEDLPDASVGAAVTVLDLERATVARGALEGLGWNDLAEAIAVPAPGCDEVGAARHPEAIPGEWVGDVDVFVVTSPEGGRLCADLRVDATDVGWDLLLARLDACGVPEAFAEGDEGPLGWARGGPQGRWDAPIEPGVAYAVTLAAYWPTAVDGEVAWRLGLSVVAPDGDGEALCPLVPEEAP